MTVVRSAAAPAADPRPTPTAGERGPEPAADHVACVLVPAETPSVPRCRRFLLACAWRWRLRRGVDEAALALSELVSNAVEHAGGPIAVTLTQRDGELRMGVTAPATAEEPRLLTPTGTMSSGRGLRIVDALARSWGWRDVGTRRTVWAVLPV